MYHEVSNGLAFMTMRHQGPPPAWASTMRSGSRATSNHWGCGHAWRRRSAGSATSASG